MSDDKQLIFNFSENTNLIPRKLKNPSTLDFFEDVNIQS